jgi:hypothetical protein
MRDNNSPLVRLANKFDNTKEGNLWDNNCFFEAVAFTCDFIRDTGHAIYDSIKTGTFIREYYK